MPQIVEPYHVIQEVHKVSILHGLQTVFHNVFMLSILLSKTKVARLAAQCAHVYSNTHQGVSDRVTQLMYCCCNTYKVAFWNVDS